MVSSAEKSPVIIAQLKLARGFAPEQAFSYAAVGRSYRQTVVSTKGAVIEESRTGMRCELAATLVVKSVRTDGRPHELLLQVFRFVVREGFVPPAGGADDVIAEPLEEGIELWVSYPREGTGEPRITLLADDDIALAPETERALKLVLPQAAGKRDEDQLFGLEGEVKIGERWPAACGWAA